MARLERGRTGVAALLEGLPLAVLGGDRREVELVRVLAEGGAQLRVAGLPAEDVPGVERFADGVSAVRGARAVIAPMSAADARLFADAAGAGRQNSAR